MSSARFLVFLGTVATVGGALMWLDGRRNGPSPGSEWPVFELVGPLIAAVGLILLVIGLVLRARRPR